MASWIFHMYVMVLSTFISCSQSKRDKVLYCSDQGCPSPVLDGEHPATCRWIPNPNAPELTEFLRQFEFMSRMTAACKAIVDELNYSISQVDPKMTINVGSFRLNPDGTMTDKKVPFVRSETHLSELLDGVCDSMSDYALYIDPNTHHKQYRRFAPRVSGSSEDFPDFENFKFDGPEASNNLKFACETLVEELEDDIISLLGQDEGDVQKKLCSRVSDYCEDDSQPNDEL